MSMCIQHLLIRSLILLSSRSANITSPFQMTEDQNRNCSNFVSLLCRCKSGLLHGEENIIIGTLKQIAHKNVFIQAWWKEWILSVFIKEEFVIYTGWMCKKGEEKNYVHTVMCSKSLWKTSLTWLRSRRKDDIKRNLKASQNPVKLRDYTSTIEMSYAAVCVMVSPLVGCCNRNSPF